MQRSELTARRCQACEGGIPALQEPAIRSMLAAVPEWNWVPGENCIERRWKLKNFVQAVAWLQKVAEIAEAEQHHPDLHLTGYRNLKIVLTTHAIAGLSENDFIVAAHIDAAWEATTKKAGNHAT